MLTSNFNLKLKSGFTLSGSSTNRFKKCGLVRINK